jgi:alpha-tubulin suppressor-like RCC1 family protein
METFMTNNAIRLFLAAAVTAALTACGGSGSTTSTIPVTVVTIYNAHSVAFKNNSAMAWGYNGSGQLGNGVTSTSNTPVSVLENGRPLTGLKGISAGSAHTLAFFNNSTVHAWGANFSGQLGNNGTSNGVLNPVGVVYKNNPTDTVTLPLRRIVGVSAGGNHSLAMTNYSTVWSWGANYAGQLGNNSTTLSTTAVKVVDPDTVASQLSGVSAIAAGGSHSLALARGQVYAWGYNNYGQLGNNTTASSTIPVRVLVAGGAPLNDVKFIAAGGAFSVAVRNDNTILAWGYNGFGQLGLDPVATPFSGVPQQIPTPGGTGAVVRAVSAGLGHILVVVQNGSTWSVWGWGFNGFGQLGGVTTNIKPEDFTLTPVQITGITGAFNPAVLTVDGMSPILAIGHHSLARTDSGLFAWGNNNYGQLGFTPVTPTYSATPTKVSGF